MKIFLTAISIFLTLISTVFLYSYANYYSNVNLIAHAGGGELEGNKHTYLNVSDLFFTHYNKGKRIFEYDFAFSSDKKLIGTHNYEYIDENITFNEYKNTKIAGKYSGVALDFIFEIIKEYPDVKIVLDTKENDEMSVIDEIISEAEKVNLDIYSAVIPQIYNKEMWDKIKDYDFHEYIFTNYKSNYDIKTLKNFLKDKPKIKTVAFSKVKLSDVILLKRLGKKIGLFTKNSMFYTLFAGFLGIDYIYTDYLCK